MKPKLIFVAVLTALCTVTHVCAEEPVKAGVDKTKLTTDQTLTYTVRITITGKKIPELQLPSFKRFTVFSTAQSSSLSFEQDNVKTILAYSFILAPISAGKFTIEPSQVVLDKKTYSSEQFEIEVTQGKPKPLQPESQNPAFPQERLPESKEPQITI